MPKLRTEHDVIRAMGRFPDKISDGSQMMLSKTWKCSKCGEIFRFNEEVNLLQVVPCKACAGIFFTKIREVE